MKTSSLLFIALLGLCSLSSLVRADQEQQQQQAADPTEAANQPGDPPLLSGVQQDPPTIPDDTDGEGRSDSDDLEQLLHIQAAKTDGNSDAGMKLFNQLNKEMKPEEGSDRDRRDLLGQRQLIIYVYRAYGLPDTDGLWNLPDPYVRISVLDSRGYWTTLNTHAVSGTTSPIWNKVLHFRTYASYFRYMSVRVWDDDGCCSSDDAMTPTQWFWLPSSMTSGWYYYNHAGKVLIYAKLI
eukprot:m.135759 g.135759  ORF g.135759 m.135759 type:complete len:238 (+) comp23925_c0_seq1:337-1050(+)